jgi:Flp pilus assembly protein TadB
VETGDGHDEDERPDEQPEEAPEEGPGEPEREEAAHGEGAERAGGRFDFERGWMAVAAVLLFAAAVLLYLKMSNAAFVLAALGLSAWFWNVRNGLKRKHDLVKRGPRNWEPRGRDEE